MAQKGRNDLNQAVSTNVYDNSNKEILAQMLRSVLEDYRDSHFNIKDDQVANMQFNSSQTVQEYLDERLGAAPVSGEVSGIDVGSGTQSLSTSGIITSASLIADEGSNSLYEVNFSESLTDRRIIPVMKYTDSNWNAHNDIVVPVIRRISSTRINVAMREVSGNSQDLTLEIILI